MRTPSGHVCVALALLAGFVSPLTAQTVPAASKPGPAHLQLGFFVGRWKYEGEGNPGPLGAGGKISGTETCEWFTGRFFVVCRSDWVTGGNEVSWQLGIVGYSQQRKRYSFYDVDNEQGEAAQGWGDFKDSTWTWEEEQPIDGRPAKQRYALKELSADSFAFREEVAATDSSWVLVETGIGTREK